VHSLESFSEAELQRVHLAIEVLSAYLLSAERFQADNQPAAGSPFVLGSKENGGIWWRETGDLALAASFDHLLAFTNLLTGNVPRQAGYSVLRGCAEAAAIAWWLFDPTVTEKKRVQRGFEERLYGIHVQRGLFEKKNRPKLEAFHDELVAEAGRNGLSEKPNTQAKDLTHFGHPRLPIQDLAQPTSRPAAHQPRSGVRPGHQGGDEELHGQNLALRSRDAGRPDGRSR
jgi:hypothetical protein